MWAKKESHGGNEHQDHWRKRRRSMPNKTRAMSVHASEEANESFSRSGTVHGTLDLGSNRRDGRRCGTRGTCCTRVESGRTGGTRATKRTRTVPRLWRNRMRKMQVGTRRRNGTKHRMKRTHEDVLVRMSHEFEGWDAAHPTAMGLPNECFLHPPSAFVYWTA